MKDYKILSTRNYSYLKNEIIQDLHFKELTIQKGVYSDKELYDILNKKEIINQDILLIGGTASDSDILEIIDYGSAIVKYGAKSLTILCPYFGYSTNERAVKEGEIVRAKTRARMISNIPQAKEGNTILLFDLHAEGIPYYFEGNIESKHIYGKKFIEDIIRNELKITEKNSNQFILASTDAGRAKWIESLGHDFNLNTAFCYKKRDGEKISLTGINANVKDKTVIIYDDMIRSGKSLINAANAYKNAGANDIYVITTHGLFVDKIEKDNEILFINPNDVAKKILDTNLFKAIYCTNSHPNSTKIKNIIVKNIGSLIITES